MLGLYRPTDKYNVVFSIDHSNNILSYGRHQTVKLNTLFF